MSSAPTKFSGPIRFGRYELVRRIGAGGMGEVWLARLPGLGGVHKVCVVKRMLPHLSSDASFLKRFVDEAKVVVHLNHGNIAQVYEMGEVDGELFMAMEYVEGKTVAKIAARLRERGEMLPLPLALYIAARACDGLAYAHRKTDPAGRPLNVVHRDVSPANIIASYDGDVKIIDFGAAQSAIKQSLTAPRVVIGNLVYMSPEQARKRPVDGRADVYSISVVLWELVAWQPLPVGGEHAERWRRAAYPHFAEPSAHRPGVPKLIDRIIMRGLASDPADRLSNAEVLRDELQRALTELAPDTSQSTLAALMRTLFAKEAAQERALVACALADRDPDLAGATASDHDARTLVESEVTAKGPETVGPRIAPPPQSSEAGPVPGMEHGGSPSTDSRSALPLLYTDPKNRAPSDEFPTVTWNRQPHRRFPRGSRRPVAATSPPVDRKVLLVKALLFAVAFVAGLLAALAAFGLFGGSP